MPVVPMNSDMQRRLIVTKQQGPATCHTVQQRSMRDLEVVDTVSPITEL
jgi:hypothetical protein